MGGVFEKCDHSLWLVEANTSLAIRGDFCDGVGVPVQGLPRPGRLFRQGRKALAFFTSFIMGSGGGIGTPYIHPSSQYAGFHQVFSPIRLKLSTEQLRRSGSLVSAWIY
jgi:hypothetical protein